MDAEKKKKGDFQLPNFKDPNLQLRLFTNRDVEAINAKLNHTRATRVRAALFPESFSRQEDNDALLDLRTSLTDQQQAATVLKLATPARELKEALADLINYMHDADFAEKFIPEIIKLLGDDDGDVVRNAAELTCGLSKSESACQVLSRSPGLLTALLSAAGPAAGEGRNGIRVRAAVVGALHNLVHNESGRLTIFKTGGIELLVRLLASPAERVVNLAISTLHSLITYQEGAKLSVRMCGGIQKMVPLLPKWKDPRLLAVVMDCLHMLAFGDSEAKLAIWNCKGPKELVDVFNRATDEKLLWTASRLLKVLSTCLHNKEKLVESGGFEAIAKKLNTKDPKLFKNYLTTLRNLSDAEADFPCNNTLISYLLQFLRHRDQEVVMYAAGIFGNLSSDKPRLKEAIFQTGGVEIIMNTLKTSKREDTTEPLLRSLRHLTAGHGLTEEVQAELRALGGLDLSMQMLHVNIAWPVIKAACGLVRNLANYEENHDVLVQLRVIPRLGQLLALACKEDRKAQTLPREEETSSFKSSRQSLGRSNASLIDGVDLSDVMEASVGALTLLAQASMINRETILELDIGPLLFRLLQDRNVSEEVSIASEALLEELRIDGGAFHEKRSEKEAEAAPSKIRPTSEQKRATLRTEEVAIYENIPARKFDIDASKDITNGVGSLSVRDAKPRMREEPQWMDSEV